MAGRVSIRYRTSPGWNGEKTIIQPINGFQFDGFVQWVDVAKLKETNVGLLKCIACGSNDWTDNGRYMNEYECACCGAFVSTEPKQ